MDEPQPETQRTDIRHVQQYAKLENEKAKLKDELTRIDAKLEQLREPVLNYFQRHNVDGWSGLGRTLYLRRELWAGRADEVSHEQACEALRAAGLGEYANERINVQSLSAFARERDKEGEEMPPELDGVIKVTEVFKIGSRKK